MTDTPLPEPVAWLHPESNWANTDRYKVLIHCQNKGPFPVPLYKYADIAQQYAGALRMVMEAVGQLFGPISSIESEEAILLRGPEPHHDAEAIIASLQNVESALYAERQAREAAKAEARSNQLHAEHEHNEGRRLSERLKEADADVERLKYENDLLAEGVGLLRERILEAEAVIAPFVTDWADENGWADNACQKDRIVDWFGPSDFRAAAAWIAKGETDVAS